MTKTSLQQSLELMADVVNSEPGNIASVTSLVLKHSLCTDSTRERSSSQYQNPIIRLRHFYKESNDIFVLTEEMKLHLANKRLSNPSLSVNRETPLMTPEMIHTPKDKLFSRVCDALGEYQVLTQNFLLYCRENQELPHIQLQKLSNAFHEQYPPETVSSSFHAYLMPAQPPEHYKCLEDELDHKLFIQPFFDGHGKHWLKNRLCDECGRIYFYKSERSKYCSDACKTRSLRKIKNAL